MSQHGQKSPAKPMTFLLVEVEWVDATSNGGWSRPEEYRGQQLAPCKSVGYLVSRDRRRVVLVQSLGVNNVTDSIVIPASCITKVRRLK